MATVTGQHDQSIETTRRSLQEGWSDRVSWGAIFAGIVCALALQALFTLLTIGLGLSMIEDGDPSGAGWGSGLFFALTSVASLFAGGWIAGRLAGMPLKPSAFLHGVVVWAGVTLGAVWFSVSMAGALLSGAAQVVGGAAQAVAATGGVATSILGNAAQGIGGAVSSVFPELEDLQMEDVTSLMPDSIKQDIEELMQGRNLTAEQVTVEVRAVGSQLIDESEMRAGRQIILNAGRQMLRNPGEADAIFQRAIDRLTSSDGPLGEQQFEELQGILQQRYGIEEARSTEIAERWQREFVQARDATVEAYRDTYNSVAQELSEAATAAAETAERAAEKTASAAWWAAFGLFLGLVAAAFGAAAGRPGNVVRDEVRV